MSFNRVLDKYRKFSFSEHDKGDRFERLMQAYLQTDPMYAHQFKNVWLWSEFPGRKDLDGKDTGIDLVGLTHEGDYWAIQCKCYQETTTLDKGAFDACDLIVCDEAQADAVLCSMDGSMGAPKRDELLSWLSEGVDVAADKALKRSRASDEDVFVEMARVVKEWLSAKEQHL